MRKFGIIVAIIAIVALTGCLSAGGGGGGAGGGAEPFIVDLSTLPLVKSPAPHTTAWQDLLILLPASSLPTDFSQYTRITITASYFKADGEELPQADAMVMVTLVYDPDGDIRGPSMGPGPNTPLKEFNVGGFSGIVNTDRGSRLALRQAPGAVLFQNNSGSPVAFIELTSLVFHNGNYSTK